MPSSFVPSRTIEQQLHADAEFNRAMDALAADGLAVAQRLVPVDTGELRDSLHIESTENGGRAVVAGTDHWLFPEFGTSTESAQPYLRPILTELGLGL